MPLWDTATPSAPSTTRGGYQATQPAPANTGTKTGTMPGFGGPNPGSPAAVGAQQAAKQLAQNGFGDLFSAPDAATADKFKSILDMLNGGQGGAALADLTGQRDVIKANLAIMDAMRGAQSGALGRNNDLAKARLDLQLEGLGIDRGAANRQIDMLGKMRGLLGEDYETQTATLQKLLDISGGDYNRVLGFLAQQEGFAGTERDLALRSAGLSRDTALRQNLSSATARGATASKGFGDTNSDIGRQYGIASDTAANNYASALASIGNKRGENQSSYDTTKTNLAAQMSNARTGFQRGLLNNDEDVAQRKDRLAQLDITARDLGLQRDQLDAALAKGIADLGLQGLADANQVASMLGSNDAQMVQIAMQIIQTGLGTK